MVVGMLFIFREVRDPRDFTARHDLEEMLFLALCARLCREKTCVDIADFVAGHEAEAREVLELRHGTPSHDTFSRVLRLIDPRALEAALGAVFPRWDGICGPGVCCRWMARRCAFDAGQRHLPPVMVSVFNAFTRLSLARKGEERRLALTGNDPSNPTGARRGTGVTAAPAGAPSAGFRARRRNQPGAR